MPYLSVPYGTDGWAGLVVLILAVALWAVTGHGWMMLLAVGPLAVLAWLATRPIAQAVPASSPTVGDLAVSISPAYGEAAGPPSRLPRSEISRRVAMTVAEKIGLPLEQVQEHSRFNEDLRLDQ